MVGDYHYLTVEPGTRITIASGDDVLAVKAAAEDGFELVGMTASEASLEIVDPRGESTPVIVEVAAGRRPRATRDVPVLGLAVVEQTRVRRFQSPSNGGELHVTSTDSVVTFDRAGALGGMTCVSSSKGAAASQRSTRAIAETRRSETPTLLASTA